MDSSRHAVINQRLTPQEDLLFCPESLAASEIHRCKASPPAHRHERRSCDPVKSRGERYGRVGRSHALCIYSRVGTMTVITGRQRTWERFIQTTLYFHSPGPRGLLMNSQNN